MKSKIFKNVLGINKTNTNKKRSKKRLLKREQPLSLKDNFAINLQHHRP